MCRIAVISYHTSPLAMPGTRHSGGLNVYVRTVTQELGRRGHCLDIFTRRTDPHSPQVQHLAPNVRLVQLAAGPLDAEKEDLYAYLPEFVRRLVAFADADGARYDLVHSHYWLSGWAGQVLKQRWGVPHVIMFHTLGEVKLRARPEEREHPHRLAAEREIAASADRVVCPSQGEKEALVRLYGVPSGRVHVVPCGVDTALFSPRDRVQARAQLGLAVDSPVVLFVGRLEPFKGLDLLLRAHARLSLPALLLIVGGDQRDEALRERLRNLARRLGTAERVTFLDAVPHERLPLYYGAADVCAVPSHYESFGLAALESMACGTPVVACRVGGLQEVVRDRVTGFLVPRSSPDQFAARLEQLLRDPSLRDSLGRRARLVALGYQWAQVAERVEAIYREVLGPRRLVTAHGGCR
ncbi:D-inositol 3-phosphate glycosyltransferase [bacterium HR24]|nr:D-inositol 3-phosphate glycosyltransferase [bacterium HR24]